MCTNGPRLLKFEVVSLSPQSPSMFGSTPLRARPFLEVGNLNGCTRIKFCVRGIIADSQAAIVIQEVPQ